ncbi:MAG: hypothetical protein NZ602_07305, partial [Thermoguttaceae bacterium]|nr:hypothetical protein [Thermoguttaceae bacterium]MDW8037002.1 hypothetical protein [Thermoguttaceae bacterium]
MGLQASGENRFENFLRKVFRPHSKCFLNFLAIKELEINIICSLDFELLFLLTPESPQSPLALTLSRSGEREFSDSRLRGNDKGRIPLGPKIELPPPLGRSVTKVFQFFVFPQMFDSDRGSDYTMEPLNKSRF